MLLNVDISNVFHHNFPRTAGIISVYYLKSIEH